VGLFPIFFASLRSAVAKKKRGRKSPMAPGFKKERRKRESRRPGVLRSPSLTLIDKLRKDLREGRGGERERRRREKGEISYKRYILPSEIAKKKGKKRRHDYAPRRGRGKKEKRPPTVPIRVSLLITHGCRKSDARSGRGKGGGLQGGEKEKKGGGIH